MFRPSIAVSRSDGAQPIGSEGNGGSRGASSSAPPQTDQRSNMPPPDRFIESRWILPFIQEELKRIGASDRFRVDSPDPWERSDLRITSEPHWDDTKAPAAYSIGFCGGFELDEGYVTGAQVLLRLLETVPAGSGDDGLHWKLTHPRPEAAPENYGQRRS